MTWLSQCLCMFEQIVAKTYHLEWVIIKMKTQTILGVIVSIILNVCHMKRTCTFMGLIQSLKQHRTFIHTQVTSLIFKVVSLLVCFGFAFSFSFGVFPDV